MDLPPELDDYIKETIDRHLGLPVSAATLEKNLIASEATRKRFQEQCEFLESEISKKALEIDKAKAEAAKNAKSIKTFAKLNEALEEECASLSDKCKKWSEEYSLYSSNRKALATFGNQAVEEAKKAGLRVSPLEEKVKTLSAELQFLKHEFQMGKTDSSSDETTVEEDLLESVLVELIHKSEAVSGRSFLESNIRHESCKKLLDLWECLSPTIQKTLSLTAEIQSLERDRKRLRINLEKS